jgi:hypothetical protein
MNEEMRNPGASATRSEVVLTIDVEWAHPEVLADVVSSLDERGLRATFFCTHEGISVPGHERALHPNFRRHGNTQLDAGAPTDEPDLGFYRRIVDRARSFCPEAVGVRAHSLFYDSDLLAVYRSAGLQYDSSCLLPLVPGLTPIWRGRGILELPLYYMDYWDLTEQATGFELPALRLDRPGLKVVAFHPNLVYLNAATGQEYLDAKERYHDPDWLRHKRRSGRGARTLFHELLDSLAGGPPSEVLAGLSSRFRAEAAAGEAYA